jgi:type II secretory pathway pseudopilin PulG
MTPRRRPRQRGTSLIEILISLAVVLVGMLALFKTLATSVTGSMTASRLTQAQQRAILVMENMRVAPKLVLNCLVSTTPASNWTTCENTCLTNLPAATNKSIDSCTYYNLKHSTGTLPVIALDTDAANQNYFVVSTIGSNPYTNVSLPPSFGLASTLFEAQVVIGWNDNNLTTEPPDHYVVLRSGVYAP